MAKKNKKKSKSSLDKNNSDNSSNSNTTDNSSKKRNKFVSAITSFFSSPFNVSLVIFILLLGVFAYMYTDDASTQDFDPDLPVVYYFYTPTCPYCNQQRPILDEVKELRPNVQFIEYDASTQEGSAYFLKIYNELGLDSSRLSVPTTIVGGRPLVGLQSKENLLSAIDVCEDECLGEQYQTDTMHNVEDGYREFELPFLGRVDLLAWSLPVLAIILGLVDGFNPCALWVLIFLITLLMGEKSKKKIWLVVGSFVLASAISYFLFMTAWLNLFLFIGYVKLLTIIIGMFALGVGILHVKEWMTTKGDLTCKVGDDESHEKTMDKIQKIISQPITLGVIGSIIVLAFVVNAIEFVCSAAIPAVFTQILALSGLTTFQHYMYILLYVFFYMLDHIIIFGMAAFALGSGLTQKYAKYCKLIGGVVMFIIGLILLFAPHLLR